MKTRTLVMQGLTTAVCSIAGTQRGRYFWAVWWSSVPQYAPFSKPDASGGGSLSREEASAEAERAAGRPVTLTDPYWAKAWNTKLRGQIPPRPPVARSAATRAPQSKPSAISAWEVLGVAQGSTLIEIKRAYRARVHETHPDRGGSAEAFQVVQRAYERLLEKRGERLQARSNKKHRDR